MAETIKHDLEELLKSANDEAMAGDMAVLCRECAKEYKIEIVKKEGTK